MSRARFVLAFAALVVAAVALLAVFLRDDRPTYLYERTGLSFRYDPEFAVYPLAQGATDYLVLRKNPDSRGYYQVAVSPFDGPSTDLSLGLLQERNPGAPMEEVGRVSLSVGEALAIEVGDDPWKTYEIWFVRDGFIYQFLAESQLAPELSDMVGGARFNNVPAPR